MSGAWWDETWSPVAGCSHAGAGCEHCWAERFVNRFSGKPGPYEGLARGGKWTGVVRFYPERLAKPLHWREPRAIFVCPHGDLFHEHMTNEQIAAAFGVMAACPQHTFLIPSKRAARRREWYALLREMARFSETRADLLVQDAAEDLGQRLPRHEIKGTLKVRPWPLPNVWDLTSCSTQAELDALWPIAADTPSAHRGLSLEPIVEPISLRWLPAWPHSDRGSALKGGALTTDHLDALRMADAVIAGGESGHDARPCDVAWLRSLRDQCKAAGVPFMCKQLGARPLTLARECGPGGPIEGTAELAEMLLVDASGADPSEWPADLRVRELPWRVRA